MPNYFKLGVDTFRYDKLQPLLFSLEGKILASFGHLKAIVIRQRP